jgi:hypothetical protein
MAVTSKLYANFLHLLLEDGLAGSILSQTIKVALLTNAYTPNQSTHDYFNDVSANEVSGAGYTAGGATLGTKTCTISSLTTTFTGADVAWADATLSNVRYAVVYYASGDAATSTLICYTDFDSDKSVSAGTFTVGWVDNKVFTLTVD